jgi:hypothetical protein
MAVTTDPQGLTQQSLLQGIAPQTGADALQIQGLQAQQQLIGPETQQNVAYANALAGIQSSQYGITQQQTGLQQTENTQQSAQNATQQGIEQQNYGLQQGAIGIQGQELGVQQQQTNLTYNNALRSQQDSGAASGGLYTHGQSSAMNTLTAQDQLQNQTLGLQNSLLNNQSQSAANTQQGEQSGYQFGQEQLQNAQSNLGLVAQANGLSNQQALTMLNYQNQQASLQGQQQNAQLLSQVGTTALGDESTIGSALGLQSFAQGSATK